jgi:hypothetical protein
MRPIMPSEGVILTWIAVDGCVGFVGERCSDLGLCRLGNKLVLLGEMHQQRRLQAVDLAQILLGVAAVIGHRGVDAVAHGRQEGHQPAKTIALDSNLADTFD